MLVQTAKRNIRRFLEARGYYVSLRRALPYGVEYMIDIVRLGEAWSFPIRTFFDVGAHFGETTSAALKAFPSAKVFAFEPHPQTFSKLTQNIGNEPRFLPNNLALGESSGTVPFFENDASELNSLAPNTPRPAIFKPSWRQLVVQCSTVDSFCAEHSISSIDVLKIDAEGCDLMVLRGAENALSSQRIRFVHAEFHAVENNNPDVQMTTFIGLHQYLAPFGFRFVATYTDWFSTNQPLMVANALFVLPGSSA
jgi:FkbM family methyltransferase